MKREGTSPQAHPKAELRGPHKHQVAVRTIPCTAPLRAARTPLLTSMEEANHLSGTPNIEDLDAPVTISNSSPVTWVHNGIVQELLKILDSSQDQLNQTL